MNIKDLQTKMGAKCSLYFCLFKTPKSSVVVLDNGFILVCNTKPTIQETLNNVTGIHLYNDLYNVLRGFFPSDFNGVSSELKNDATVKEKLAKSYVLQYEMGLVYKTMYLEMEYYLNGRKEIIIELSINADGVSYSTSYGPMYRNQTPQDFLDQFFSDEFANTMPKNLFISSPLVIVS